jgi:hypothetical protein
MLSRKAVSHEVNNLGLGWRSSGVNGLQATF